MTKPTETQEETRPAQRMELLAQRAMSLGIELADAQLAQFQTHYSEMVLWNRRVNITGITEWQEVLTKHFLDSLSVGLAIPDELKSKGVFLDVGAGAGFPGIPLLIAFTGMRGTLLDSTAKKTAFLRHIVDALGLDAAEVITDRAETLARSPEHRERYDLVFGRGVAGMSVLAELTLPFARVGGLVVAQKLVDADEEMETAENAIGLLGGRLKEVIPVAQKGLENRALVVVEKISRTPDRYPRRAGIPSKRPL